MIAPAEAKPEVGTRTEVHHRVPRHLVRLHDRATSGSPGEITGEGIEACLEFEHEATRYGVPVEIAREDLERLVEGSTVEMPAGEHREEHSAAGDFARWGRIGGTMTLRCYGSAWFALLARRRWGRITADQLAEAFVCLGGGSPGGTVGDEGGRS